MRGADLPKPTTVQWLAKLCGRHLHCLIYLAAILDATIGIAKESGTSSLASDSSYLLR